MDDLLRARERLILEGSATEAEVEAWDAQRIRIGNWSAELVGRQVMRLARKILKREDDARLCFDGLRGLVNEARKKTHWCRASAPSFPLEIVTVEHRTERSAYANLSTRAPPPTVRRVVKRVMASIGGGPGSLTLCNDERNGSILASWAIQGSGAAALVDALHMVGKSGVGFLLQCAPTKPTSIDLAIQTYDSDSSRNAVVIAALEPDQVALAVVPKLSSAPWRPAPAGLVEPISGGWHPSVCEWIDLEAEWKLVAPRSVVEDWAGVHWRTK